MPKNQWLDIDHDILTFNVGQWSAAQSMKHIKPERHNPSPVMQVGEILVDFTPLTHPLNTTCIESNFKVAEEVGLITPHPTP